MVHEAVPVSERLLRGFMAKLEQAQLLLPSLEQAGFTVIDRELVRLPFTFATGREAVTFFNDLFRPAWQCGDRPDGTPDPGFRSLG